MHDVTMPKLSDSMEVGKVIKWKVKEGDEVREGDILADVESDKAVMELESFYAGVVTRIVKGDGAEVPVGEIIAFIGEKGDEVSAPEPSEPDKSETPRPAEAEAVPTKPAAPAPSESSGRPEQGEGPPATEAPSRPAGQTPGRVAVSPYAKKLAKEKGIDYTLLTGTGPGGRVIASDVEAAAAGVTPSKARPTPGPRKSAPEVAAPAAGQAAAPAEIESMARALAERYGVGVSTLRGTGTFGRITVEDVLAARPLECCPVVPPSPDEELPALELAPDEADVEDAPFRLKTQARRVTAAKHVIPHFYITRGADVSRLLARKDEFKEKHHATITHVVMLAVLETLKKHPEINRSYDRGRIIKWKGVHLGLAIATEQGLTVAVLKNAQTLSLGGISERVTELVTKARAGKLTADERRHPTFTITNLGMYDVEHFEPIINPPGAMTLAVASALATPVVRGDAIHIGMVMKLTVSCDHRIIDGAMAAAFLKDLRSLLEDPDVLLRDA